MAKKSEEKNVKKSSTKGNSAKKTTNSKKKVNVSEEVKETNTKRKKVVEEVKESVKKENKVKVFFKNVWGKIKLFFNHPAPLVIALIILNFISLLYITSYEDNNQIYVGSINKGVSVGSIHFFTNNDINYFYASSATYLQEDKDVYTYEIGYYVKKGNELIPFATRSGKLEKASSLGSIVNELSGWEIVEAYNAQSLFKPEIVPHMDKLYFVINASTQKDSTKADVHFEIEVENTKVTK